MVQRLEDAISMIMREGGMEIERKEYVRRRSGMRDKQRRKNNSFQNRKGECDHV